jgi:hypothetical protein
LSYPYPVRLAILDGLYKAVQKKFNENLKTILGAKQYEYHSFMNAVRYHPDPVKMVNHYYLDAGDTQSKTDGKTRNEVLGFMEYGTGLYGAKAEWIESNKISPRTGKQMMLKFTASDGSTQYKIRVRGIRPGFMYTKALEYVEHNKKSIINKVLRRLGY